MSFPTFVSSVVKPFIVKIEHYCYYFFLMVLFIGLSPSVIMYEPIHKNMHIYFAIFYTLLLITGLPTLIAFLARWGRFENLDIFDRKLK